ncbi:cupin domain-containing protein [Lichenihabitans sp. PAMC28606]|uniref:cupin domain-containing protein n=1 Tax=Lichenihabitans sp. PAMC28606 TaxID=2880932 RepID=UPI001D0B0725|nr:cupin domain-containing protein [Lichenihabitans sp. PAMC28606]UDL94610.1 cupin domain-containing protein [Lichenihabitans sp. PAMC28606]
MAFSCTIPARPTVQVDDDRVRITRWDFEPGACTGWHEHAMPYCVIMVLGGTLALHDGTTESQVTLAAGDAYARPSGIKHDVKNASDHPIAFVEVEMKR